MSEGCLLPVILALHVYTADMPCEQEAQDTIDVAFLWTLVRGRLPDLYIDYDYFGNSRYMSTHDIRVLDLRSNATCQREYALYRPYWKTSPLGFALDDIHAVCIAGSLSKQRDLQNTLNTIAHEVAHLFTTDVSHWCYYHHHGAYDYFDCIHNYPKFKETHARLRDAIQKA